MKLLLIAWLFWGFLPNVFSKQITITAPTTVAAGTTTSLTVNFNPTLSSSSTYDIKLSCPNIPSKTTTYASSTASPSFSVPSDFYGSCTFYASSASYQDGTALTVVTQIATFTSPINAASITINNAIPVKLATAGNVAISQSITVSLFCNSVSGGTVSVTTNAAAITPFNYLSSVYGACTLTLSSAPSFIATPYPTLSVYLKYPLRVTPPSTAYIGQTFQITVSSTQTVPAGLKATLNLYRTSSPSTILQTFTNIAIGSNTLTLTSPLAVASDYYLQVSQDDNNFIGTTPVNQFSVANVPLRFASPANGESYVYSDTIPILVNSAQVANVLPAGSQVSVTFSCPGYTAPAAFPVAIGTESSFTNGAAGIGTCTISAISSISYLIAPSSITVTRTGTVSISAPSTIAAGSQPTLTLTYNPTPPSAVTSSVTLTCPGITPVTRTVLGPSPTFLVPSDFYGSSCVFSVAASGYNSVGTATSTITQALTFTNPTNTAITINNAIPVQLATAGNTVISQSIELLFACTSGASDSFSVTTNLASFDYAYPSSSYGPCSFSVTTPYPPNYIATPYPTLSLSLKYPLNITPPQKIYIGQSFQVPVSSTQTVAAGLKTQLLLFQAGSTSILEPYNNIIIGTNTLILPDNLTPGSSYYLKTPSTDPNFIETTSSEIEIAKLPLQFSKPTDLESFLYSDVIPILINSNEIGSIQPATASVKLSCPNYVDITDNSISIGVDDSLTNTLSAIGLCTLSTTSVPTYMIAPSSISIKINGTVLISVTSPIAAGSSAALSLTFAPVAPSSVSVKLQCSETLETTETVLILNPVFPVPSDFYGSNCNFTVISDLYNSNNDASAIITQPLTFESPVNNALITINDTIPVSMKTGTTTTISDSVELELSCGGISDSSATFSVITNSPSNYGFPADLFGPCTLSVIDAPDYYVLPSSISLNLKYAITIQAPSLMYIGQTFNLTVSCGYTPGVPSVPLDLFDSSSPSSLQPFTVDKFNEQITFTLNTDIVPGTDYFFQTPSDSLYFIQAISSPTSTVSKVTLQFASPLDGEEFINPFSIPILVNSADIWDIEPTAVDVDLSCSGTLIDTFEILLGEETIYLNPKKYTGSCSLSVSSSISYLINPSPVSISLNGTVSIEADSVIPAGTTTIITLIYEPIPTSPVSSIITLECSNTMIQQSPEVTGSTVSFIVPPEFYGSACKFSVNVPYYNSISTAETIITQPLTFSSPKNFTSITISDPIPIELITGDTSISTAIGLELTCVDVSGSTPISGVFTNQQKDYEYPSDYYGSCAITVTNAPSYFALPGTLYLSLEYEVTITPPSIIYIGQPFLTTVTGPQNIQITSVDLNLLCPIDGADSIVDSWTDVELNKQVQLQASTSLNAATGCYLQTPLNDLNIQQANSTTFSVSVIQLQFAKPTTFDYTQKIPIPLLINFPALPSLNDSISVTFACLDSTPDTFVYKISEEIDYHYSYMDYGTCEFSVTSSLSYILAPAPLEVTIEYGLTFITAPSIIYIGQPFKVQIDSSATPLPPAFEDINLDLYCDNNLIKTWTGVTLNAEETLQTDTDISDSTNCYLQTAANSTVFKQVTSNTLTLSSFEIRFVTPNNNPTLLEIPEDLPILIDSALFPALQESIELEFDCPESSTSDTFNVTTADLFYYPYLEGSYGACTLSIIAAPGYLTIPPNFINLKLQYLPLDYVVTPLYVGKPFNITINTNGTTSPYSISKTTLELFCAGVSVQSWEDVYFNRLNELSLLNTVPDSTDCEFVTPDSTYFLPFTSDKVTITAPIPLSFTKPAVNQIITINSSIPILIEGPSAPQDPVTVQLTCGTFESVFEVIVGIETDYDYPDNVYGSCILVVIDTPIDLNPPDTNRPFSLKYQLEFVDTPATIYISKSFEIQINTTYSVVPDNIEFITLNLKCNGNTVQYWNNVQLNQLVTLSLNDDLAPSSSCLFSTEANPAYYEQSADANVILSAIPLQFSLPTIDQLVIVPNAFNVLVSSSIYPQLAVGVTGQLSCNGTNPNSPIVTEFPLTTSTSSPINYIVNGTFFGNCTVSLVNLPGYLEAPTPVDIDMKFELSFDPSVPSTIYIGQSFLMKVNSSYLPPSPLDEITMDLICPTSVLVDSWRNVPLETEKNLTLTTSATTQSNCIFVTTANDDFFINAESDTVAIEKATISIILPPDNLNYTIPNSFEILVRIDEAPDAQNPAEVMFNCEYPNTPVQIDVTTGVVLNYDYNPSYYGLCSISLTNVPSYYISGPPVYFHLKYALSIVDLPPVLFIGNTFTVNVTSSSTPLPASINSTTTLALFCNDVLEQTWYDLPLNELKTLPLNQLQISVGRCRLSTFSDEDYFVNDNEIVSVSSSASIPLQFLIPEPSSVTLYPNPIDISLVAVGFPSLSEEITAQIICSQSGNSYSFPLYISAFTSLTDYPSNLYGDCTLEVSNAPGYYILPPIVPFNLKYSLSFASVPSTVYIGKPFSISLQSSSPVVLSYGTDISLVCGGGVAVQSWTNIPVGIPVTLTASSNLAPANGCAFVASSDNPVYSSATSPPVFVTLFQSPIGGNVYPITPEEIQTFISSNTFSPSVFTGVIQLSSSN